MLARKRHRPSERREKKKKKKKKKTIGGMSAKVASLVRAYGTGSTQRAPAARSEAKTSQRDRGRELQRFPQNRNLRPSWNTNPHFALYASIDPKTVRTAHRTSQFEGQRVINENLPADGQSPRTFGSRLIAHRSMTRYLAENRQNQGNAISINRAARDGLLSLVARTGVPPRAACSQ
jgi:hypothetical protein